ncbi:hypothetical protein [Pseudoruegeria sp. HB172150]|uniref:hypothetical protein n=1 Tax=Pseudoruegeria sp. HB172150 TaxID=2721164 RepID=UPI001552839E|nr:hypothetical protein [Pseudoruegeria sp. HB172150]
MTNGSAFRLPYRGLPERGWERRVEQPDHTRPFQFHLQLMTFAFFSPVPETGASYLNTTDPDPLIGWRWADTYFSRWMIQNAFDIVW